jgi:hypothetical protein
MVLLDLRWGFLVGGSCWMRGDSSLMGVNDWDFRLIRWGLGSERWLFLLSCEMV